MNHDSGAATGPRDGENKKRNFEGKLINGDRNAPGTPTVNGAPTADSGGAPPVSAPSAPSTDRFADLPPEIAHIAQELYHPLSTLLLRISQETYNDLSETLQAMAEIPLVPQTNGVLSNGLGAHGAGQENAEANRRKKLLLMNAAGERNPDIRTALEILSTGKAPWMPTMGYIAPEPISSEQALKLLRYMDTSLSIRLNVHETLPRRLQNWRVKSGRATFVIENELEFDVVSFVEDTSQQWWFLDVRLLFSPAPVIVEGSHFYTNLKRQADFILREKGGLDGLFDFLSNFVLTHKISVLRSQAIALVGTRWAGSLKVENVHRELVVSYWTNRPGKKNWIEIGISNNKVRNGKTSWRGPPLPSLTVRWFRQGVEVKGVDFGFDWRKLSFERIIKRVIAYHANDILQTTKQHLEPQIAAHANLSDTEPADSKLQLALGTTGNSTSLCLEPVTGNYILQPATLFSAKAEYEFNQGKEPKRMAIILTTLLAQTLRGRVEKYAQQLGWNLVSQRLLRPDVVKAAVQREVLQFAMYSPRSWSSGWALANVVDVSGSSWWILEIGGNGLVINHAEEIKMERPDGSTLDINRSTLGSLERVAVQILSLRVTARQLDKEKKQYKPQVEFGGNLWHIATGRMIPSAAKDMQRLMAASPQKFFKFSEDGRFQILLSTPFGQDILGELRARLRDVNRLRSFTTTLQKREMRLVSSSLQRVEFQYGPSPHCAAVKFSTEKEVMIEISHSNPHHRLLKLLTEIANERIPSLPAMFSDDTNGLDRLCTTLVLTRPLVTALKKLEDPTTNVNLRNPAIFAHSLFKYRLCYENPICTFDIRVQVKDDNVHWFIEDNIKKHTLDMRPFPERNPTHRRLDNLQAKLKELFSAKDKGWFGTRNGLITEIDGVGLALDKLNKCVRECTMEGGYKPPPPLEVAPPVAKPQAQAQAQAQQQQVNSHQQAANQQRAQQLAQARQQAQQQAQRRQSQNQQNSRGQMPNGRSHQQGNNRPGQPARQQDIIEID
ncbi:hypothetical protein CC86DRAFT_445334 [Ophiobolus disseminans]|uniref:Mediator of RNA polymerase II transcription subunit 14 n=1 Tax=Ophiobolus disseminans TaxID=1469910 RepID=A0A6A7A244_9PLEO|nr:hypothetical protein CC86DRAFT_445334 [Ophiobolus disseminans]